MLSAATVNLPRRGRSKPGERYTEDQPTVRTRFRATLATALLGLCLAMDPLRSAALDESTWDALLAACVAPTADGGSTVVDYDCFGARRNELGAYLAALGAVDRGAFAGWPESEQLAFLINAYNAWTVELILTAWPELESIRDLGSLLRSPWKKTFIPLLGETVSLDDIEHGIIREPGRFDEPRIHFAVNCASIGCPALRREAYRAERLEKQLEEQTRQFLGDRSRNRLRGDTLEVSSLFKWYRGDFESGWRGATSLRDFLALYAAALGLTEKEVAALRDGDLDIEHLDYDWRLNAPAAATAP